MTKIKIESDLYKRAKAAAEQAGYSDVTEFVVHAIETALAAHEEQPVDTAVEERLRGLGYIE